MKGRAIQNSTSFLSTMYTISSVQMTSAEPYPTLPPFVEGGTVNTNSVELDNGLGQLTTQSLVVSGGNQSKCGMSIGNQIKMWNDKNEITLDELVKMREQYDKLEKKYAALEAYVLKKEMTEHTSLDKDCIDICVSYATS